MEFKDGDIDPRGTYDRLGWTETTCDICLQVILESENRFESEGEVACEECKPVTGKNGNIMVRDCEGKWKVKKKGMVVASTSSPTSGPHAGRFQFVTPLPHRGQGRKWHKTAQDALQYPLNHF